MQSIDKHILWLTAYDGMLPIKKYELYKHFKSAEALYKAKLEEIKETKIISASAAEKLVKSKNEAVTEEIIYKCIQKNIRFISIEDKDYPEKLSEIPDPPLGLFVVGEIPKSVKSAALIGSRRCTEYGATQAYKFAKAFAQSNTTVISGMAMGIDSKAHLGALDGGGKTIAVLGCGADVVYPSSNNELRERIVKNGCVISEYPPQAEPLRAHFPLRNRIISGLSDAVCVIEAAKRSGTLITVNQALEQGRDVFAMPGNITSVFSQGCNSLIKSGAYPLTEPSDLYEVIGEDEAISDKNNDIKENDKKVPLALATEEKMVYDCIGLEPVTVDEIIFKTNSQVQTIQYILTMLEIKGYVTRLSGQKYIRAL